jgi:hypothetical protein
MTLQIVLIEAGAGWQPIRHVAELAASLLQGRLTIIARDEIRAGTLNRLRVLQPRRRGADPCLVIAPGPGDLDACTQVEGWSDRFGFVAAWVIDSFWAEWVPRRFRFTRNIDHFFVTNPEDVDAWRRGTGVPTSVLAWGTDALKLGSGSAARDIDLLRIGRQPGEWDDDVGTAAAAARYGLRFGGRPPMPPDPRQSHANLLRVLARARFVLAFSNAVDPQAYTHPTREYVTGRWMDALAAGAVVCGIPPECEVARRSFWPGALLRLHSTDREAGLATVRAAVQAWTPEIALRNYRGALQRLDWRWRLRELAGFMGIESGVLNHELAQIEYGTHAEPSE